MLEVVTPVVSLKKNLELTQKKSDVVISDGDFLHPEKVYLKNNKPIGFEYRSGGEFGFYSKLTFIDDSNNIEKIIIRKDFFSNLEETFDSIFVLEPKLNKVTVYSNENQKGEEILNSKMIENELFDLDKKINQIKN